MYRVIVADDEPMALNLLKTLIPRKNKNFQVTGTAFDGEEALELIQNTEPDVLITDIQMPVMDGLKLVEAVREQYPELICVLVSGYQEFAYARQAIRFGVTEYILKPVVPSEFAGVLQKLEKKLDIKYFEHRNRLMHQMVNGISIPENELEKYFQSKTYYGAIIRRNGLPTRFSERNRKEIFSDINEWMLTYGRDDQETFYLCPQEILCGSDFAQMIQHQMEKEQPDASYITTVICRKPVSVADIGEMIRSLYKILNLAVVIGESQTLVLDSPQDYVCRKNPSDRSYLKEIEYLIQSGKYENLEKKLEEVLKQWGEEKYPQIWMEGQIRQICYLLEQYDPDEDFTEYEFLLDEAFATAENIEQLYNSLRDIFLKDRSAEENILHKNTPEKYFQEIKEYIRIHMAEQLNLQEVSHKMGISQTYLSKLFRKYEDTTFNNYLTDLRMKKAKELLGSKEKIFVKDVAEQVGYRDQFYFSRIFYSYTGIRPSEYGEKQCQTGTASE